MRSADPVYNTAAFRRPIITLDGTARTLNMSESNSVVILDRLAGNTITLPDAPIAGTEYEIIAYKAPTTNSHKIITGLISSGGTNSVLVGGVVMGRVSSALTTSFRCAEGATSNRFASVVMNGDTQGGHPGTRLIFTALSAGTWYVQGVMMGTGVQQSPFDTATS